MVAPKREACETADNPDLTADLVYGCDETAVFYDCVGRRTVAEKNSKTVGLKSTGHHKQNVTFMLLVSAAGTKKRPMIN